MTDSEKKPGGTGSSEGDPEAAATLAKDPSILRMNISELLKINDFVLVSFLTTDTLRYRYFVGVIEEKVTSTVYRVRYLEEKVGRQDVYFHFPYIDDVHDTVVEDIIEILNVKSIGRHRYIPVKFQTVNDYNKICRMNIIKLILILKTLLDMLM